MIGEIAAAVLVDRVRRTAVANMSNYEQEHASFRLAVPELFNFGFDVVDRWAEDPSKLAMLWVDDAGQRARYTFADMRRESNRFASVLQGLGVRQGDGAMLVLPRLPVAQHYGGADEAGRHPHAGDRAVDAEGFR